MPTNTLIYPHINGLTVYKAVPDTDDRFLSKHMDDWQFSDTILPWEEITDWCQPWMTSDTIKLQLQSTYGPVNLKMYRVDDDVLIDTIPFVNIISNFNNTDLRIYEVDVDLSTYDEGCYYFQITFGSPVALTLRTNNIELSEIIENTLLLEYKHPSFREDMIFETGIFPSCRIPGCIKYERTASKSTVYEDQPLNNEVLRSVNYRISKLYIGIDEYGQGSGIPDHFADKITRMIGCSDLLLDGRYYAKKSEGDDLEAKDSEGYPMRGWTIDLRDKFNRASKHYVNEIGQNAQVAVIVNVDSKGFGNSNSGNLTVITDIE